MPSRFFHEEESVLKKKRVICLLIILIVVGVCLLPQPTRINERLYGAALTQEGEIYEEVTLTVKGWYFHYLFFEDTMDLNITFESGFEPFKYVNVYGKLLRPAPDYYIKYYTAYDADTGAIMQGQIRYKIALRCILISCPDNEDFQYITGSIDTVYYPPEMILQMF